MTMSIADINRFDAMFRDIIAKLSKPVSEEETAFGWNPAIKKQFYDYYQKQLSALHGNIDELHRRGGTARAMDFQGINGGELQRMAARIDNASTSFWKKATP